ncbi:MAG: hypothetical protein QF890_07545 [Myxococcota bacterium]|nr:hypothetical protein [Myxococcota bacterium]MDP7073379.1 hypothetical protein [Myxococcota bacterium]MDP7297858.1 hypothetical protein [Myxococcota bacterium]MDP7432411.1 hypothetical protein [Myxococcota bacterium]
MISVLRLLVAERGLVGPPTAGKRGLHPRDGSFRPLSVLEVGEDREHPADQLARRTIVERLGGGTKRDPEFVERCADHLVVEHVPGEAAHVVDDHEVEALPILRAVGEHPLELSALGGLRGRALVDKDAVDFDLVPGAVVVAVAPLGVEAEILDLFCGGDAGVYDGPGHVDSRSWADLGRSGETFESYSWKASRARSATV